ncbi:MAG TPA: pyruvate kinase [Firmicutes bacterium]|nr:pyruvate kinase [Bacillota bacterium]
MEQLTKNTKIVCTIGPASESKEMLLKLIRAGMNVARINFSHGNYEEHLKKINTIREIEKEEKLLIPIMLDTKGPEIRTHDFVGGQASINTGDIVRISMEKVLGDNKLFSVTFPGLYDDVKVGDKIKLDDGNLTLVVTEKDKKNKQIVTKALNHDVIRDKRGVNCPDSHLSLPFISEQDLSDLIWGCEHHVNYVAASFVRNKDDILQIRNILKEHGGENILIISKVENTESVKNLDEIIEYSDGLMVARGDLGVEIPPEEVPLVQREMIEKCKRVGKPVITATQMLDSMKHNPNPTRAEVSDVANAVLEGTDAVMLSAESASGEYPEEAVAMQRKISSRMETLLDYEALAKVAFDTSNKTVNAAIANSVCDTALLLNAKLIVCFSETGATARRVSKARPCCPVIGVSNNLDVCYAGVLNWGVYPKPVKKVPQFIEEMEVLAIHLARVHNIPTGSTIIITGGTPVGAGKTNFMKVITLDDISSEVDI